LARSNVTKSPHIGELMKITGVAMADTKSLSTIGFLLGAAAMMVMMVGTFVVFDHLTGRLQIDDDLSAISLPSAAR
jgi:hypothetical protein